MPIPDRLTGIRGAIYFPTNAFNTYQTWWLFDREQVAKDLDYARWLGINGLRVFLSYEWWHEHWEGGDGENPMYTDFAWFLDQCSQRGIRVMPVFFEPIGDRPTTERLRDRDINTSFPVQSPDGEDIIRADNWGGYPGSPVTFTREMVQRFDSHDALLAWEAMNEPGGWDMRVAFTQDILGVIRHNGDKPITVGAKAIHFNEDYDDPPVDIYQWHDNIPPTAQSYHDGFETAAQLREELDKPVWCTEWQRTRVEPPVEWLPNYKSAAHLFHNALNEQQIDGHFMWQLMFKPAYMRHVRELGRVNGLFHPDGRVFDSADARAVSRRLLPFSERHEYPDWMKAGDFPWAEINEDRPSEWEKVFSAAAVPAVGTTSLLALDPIQRLVEKYL